QVERHPSLPRRQHFVARQRAVAYYRHVQPKLFEIELNQLLVVRSVFGQKDATLERYWRRRRGRGLILQRSERDLRRDRLNHLHIHQIAGLDEYREGAAFSR